MVSMHVLSFLAVASPFSSATASRSCRPRCSVVRSGDFCRGPTGSGMNASIAATIHQTLTAVNICLRHSGYIENAVTPPVSAWWSASSGAVGGSGGSPPGLNGIKKPGCRGGLDARRQREPAPFFRNRRIGIAILLTVAGWCDRVAGKSPRSALPALHSPRCDGLKSRMKEGTVSTTPP